MGLLMDRNLCYCIQVPKQENHGEIFQDRSSWPIQYWFYSVNSWAIQHTCGRVTIQMRESCMISRLFLGPFIVFEKLTAGWIVIL